MASLRPVSADEIEIARHRRLDSRHRRRRQPLPRAAQHAPALPRRASSCSLMDADRSWPTTTLWPSSPTWARRWSARSASPTRRRWRCAVTMMEEYLGRTFRAIMSLEIGGGNAIQPFMAAALLDLPVVDGDCMGRAFPEAQMTSFAIHDLQMYPLTLVDVRDNAVVVARAASWKWMERHQPQGVRGGRLDRLHLQGPAHRQGDQGVRDPRLHHQGHPDRPDGAGRAAGPPRSDRRACSRPSAGIMIFTGKIARHRAPGDRGLPARHRHASTASTTSAANASSSPSRTSSRWAGSTASRAS